MMIRVRNQIPVTVKMIKKSPVSTEVVVSIAGGNEIVLSITTHNSARCPLLPEKGVCRKVGFKMDIFGNGGDLEGFYCTVPSLRIALCPYQEGKYYSL